LTSRLNPRLRRDNRRDDNRDRREPSGDELATTRRRNEHALKSIVGKKPSLPKNDGPFMRTRGWRKSKGDK